MNKNEIIEPDNEQGRFETALRILEEKLANFHCPICHAEDGITFYDDPFFVMHYDWDKSGCDDDEKNKRWKLGEKGYGKTSILGICNNCGYTMLFNTAVISAPYKRLAIIKETVHIKKVVEQIERRKKASASSKQL